MRPGERHGHLTALHQVDSLYWAFRCDCGALKNIRAANVRRGLVVSCTCQRKRLLSEQRTKHGKSKSEVYRIWVGIKDRCTNPNDPAYPRYGGRGIKVCERWINSFENFFEDMGDRPAGQSIERVDNDGDYDPSNCVWASRTVQNRNKSTNRLIAHAGAVRCLNDWAAITGINRDTLRSRLDKGWSAADALSVPVDAGKRNKLTKRPSL